MVIMLISFEKVLRVLTADYVDYMDYLNNGKNGRHGRLLTTDGADFTEESSRMG